MILVNTDYITEKKFRMICFVSGSCAKVNFVSDEEAECALKNMIASAEKLGADAIINVRFTAAKGLAYFYGTAVRFIEPESN